MRYSMSPEQHARIFGQPDPMDSTGTGRARLCKACGGWHKRGHVPHNCRPEPPRRANLATPMVAPPFGEFKVGPEPDAEIITNRHERREYMARNDLVDYAPGVGQRNEWVEEYENDRDIVADIKRFAETDPLNLPPDLRVTEYVGDDPKADAEIDTDNMDMIE